MIMAHWFAQPWLLLTLAGLPLLIGLLLWSSARRRQSLLRLGPRIARLDSLPRPRGWMRLRRLCLGLGLLLLSVGMAGPQWGRDWGQSAAPGRDVMVVVDCSRSMLAETPSRLERARTALLDLVRAIQIRGGDRLGLVVFAGKSRLLCPLTHDYDHFRSALEKLDLEPFDPDLGPGSSVQGKAVEESGTRIGLGLHEAIRFHGMHRAARDILLLSDGDDPAHDGEWHLGSDEAREQGIPVYTIGLGDPDEPSPIRIGGNVQTYEGKEVRTRLEEAPLREIAQLTGGQYIAARTRALPLGQVYLDLAGLAHREQSDDILPVYRQRYPWFLGPALGLLMLCMVLPEETNRQEGKGARKSRKNGTLLGGFGVMAVLLLAAAPAEEARTWLQRGNEAFGRGEYEIAIAHYEKAERGSTDPGEVAFNLATARYFLASSTGTGRNANLREAELLYRCCLDPDDPRHLKSLYGLGTCLLQSAGLQGGEELHQAVTFFDRCLLLHPDSELRSLIQNNREAARLRLAQVQSTPERRSDTPPNERPRPDRPDPRHGKNEQGDGAGQSGDRYGPKGRPMPASPDGKDSPSQTADQRAPGKGHLPPIPDDAALPPLSPQDAAEHLEQASRRILDEGKAYRQQRTRPPQAGVRDW